VLAEVKAPRPSQRRVWRWLMAGAGSLLLLLTGTYQWVAAEGSQGVYRELAAVPAREYAMMLGTAPTVYGRPNRFFVYRIDATVALWRAGKFEKLILSGARRKGYDEIAVMRRDLIAAGIPAERMLEDGDGHRTRLSVQRAESVFGLKDYLIVTQQFHCERALFIARRLGQQPICYAAQDVPYQPRMLVRELLSRLMAAWEYFRG
jgi:SanA protein